jgi:hypothetical protein
MSDEQFIDMNMYMKRVRYLRSEKTGQRLNRTEENVVEKYTMSKVILTGQIGENPIFGKSLYLWVYIAGR